MTCDTSEAMYNNSDLVFKFNKSLLGEISWLFNYEHCKGWNIVRVGKQLPFLEAQEHFFYCPLIIMVIRLEKQHLQAFIWQ